MPTDRSNDPLAFRDFLDAKLADPGNHLALAEILALWAAENQTDADRDEARRRVENGLDFVARSAETTPSHTVSSAPSNSSRENSTTAVDESAAP